MANLAVFYDGTTPDTPEFTAQILAFFEDPDTYPRAGYGAGGVMLGSEGTEDFGFTGYVLTSEGLARSGVVLKTASYTINLSDAGRIIEMSKARESEAHSFWVDASTGTFTLTIAGNSTDPIPENASTSAILEEIEELLNIGAGGVDSITGSGTEMDPYVVIYNAGLGEVGSISITVTNGTGDAEVVTTAVTTVALMIPDDDVTSFPKGTRIDLVQAGTCQIAVGITDGTLQCASVPQTSTQWSGASLYKRADTNEWVLIGDLQSA